jgi:hypothetical protein
MSIYSIHWPSARSFFSVDGVLAHGVFALLAGGFLLAAVTVAAERGPQKLMGYAEDDQEICRGQPCDARPTASVAETEKSSPDSIPGELFSFGEEWISGRYP